MSAIEKFVTKPPRPNTRTRAVYDLLVSEGKLGHQVSWSRAKATYDSFRNEKLRPLSHHSQRYSSNELSRILRRYADRTARGWYKAKPDMIEFGPFTRPTAPAVLKKATFTNHCSGLDPYAPSLRRKQCPHDECPPQGCLNGVTGWPANTSQQVAESLKVIASGGPPARKIPRNCGKPECATCTVCSCPPEHPASDHKLESAFPPVILDEREATLVEFNRRMNNYPVPGRDTSAVCGSCGEEWGDHNGEVCPLPDGEGYPTEPPAKYWADETPAQRELRELKERIADLERRLEQVTAEKIRLHDMIVSIEAIAKLA